MMEQLRAYARAVRMEQENIIAAADPGQAGIIVSLFVGEHVGGLSLERGVKLNRRKLLSHCDKWLHEFRGLHQTFSRTWVAAFYHRIRDLGVSHV